MYSAGGNAVLPAVGFPIRESADQWLFSASPRLIAAVHALLRLLVPRHPPCALDILTVIIRFKGRTRRPKIRRYAEGQGKPLRLYQKPELVRPATERCQQVPSSIGDTRLLDDCAVFKVRREGARPGLGRSVSQNSTACGRSG